MSAQPLHRAAQPEHVRKVLDNLKALETRLIMADMSRDEPNDEAHLVGKAIIVIESLGSELDKRLRPSKADDFTPRWQVFDKDDPSTWPSESGFYWTVTDVPLTHGPCVERLTWTPRNEWTRWAAHCITHWMPVEVPELPTVTSKEES